MTETKVQLEHVSAAARLALALSVGASLLTLAVALVSGLPLALASIAAAAVLPAGWLSGGFGLAGGRLWQRRAARGHALVSADGLRSPARMRRLDRAGGGASVLRAGR